MTKPTSRSDSDRPRSPARAALAITLGEPAGIGPDICLLVAGQPCDYPLVAVGDRKLLASRARQLGAGIELTEYDPAEPPRAHSPGRLPVIHVPVAHEVKPGELDPGNAESVLQCLRLAARGCMERSFAAMVTAPVHKGVINDAGIRFSGHTEFLADLAGEVTPVMMLCAGELRVALATTHLPLSRVSAALNAEALTNTIEILHRDLERLFGCHAPRIVVCGLNPHAGEGGHLGSEEETLIEPVVAELAARGLRVEGPVPADTAFTPARLEGVAAVLAMYHDQGLPVLKYAGFGRAVNVTLGLPFIRTSVDHGTALDLAGSGKADAGSLAAAIGLAGELAEHQSQAL